MSSKYINNNGNIITASTPVFTYQNRAFRYGDGLFEALRIMNGKINFLDEHFGRLIKGMKILKMLIPENFSPGFFNTEINELTAKNNTGNNGRIRISVYRNAGGLYTPSNNNVSYLIEIQPVELSSFSLNAKGLKIGLFDECNKPIHPLSNVKTSNSLIFVLAGIFKTEKGLDDCIIKNSNNEIAEAISSNIFIVRNNKIFTPPLNSGCVSGIMRNHIINLIVKNNITFTEQPLTDYDLMNANEVFLTNVVEGIRWVEGLQTKTYKNSLTKVLADKLNSSIQTKEPF